MEKRPNMSPDRDRYPDFKQFWSLTFSRAVSDYDADLLMSRHGIHMMWLGTSRPEEYVRGFLIVKDSRDPDGMPARQGSATILKVTQTLDETYNEVPGLTFSLETLRPDDRDTDYSELQAELEATLAILEASDGQSPYPPELHGPIVDMRRR